jgi:hypothetical protein
MRYPENINMICQEKVPTSHVKFADKYATDTQKLKTKKLMIKQHSQMGSSSNLQRELSKVTDGDTIANTDYNSSNQSRVDS